MPYVMRIDESIPGTAPGFDQPFAMLEACHERVQRTLDLLLRLREHIARHRVDEQARQAALDVLRYFDVAAPQHHLDEERHVLPVLEASADQDLAQLAHRLRRDHFAMEQGWATARAILAKVADGSLAELSAEQEQALSSFAALYADHIAAEEDLAFPAALARLAASELSAMSSDMVQRRRSR